MLTAPKRDGRTPARGGVRSLLVCESRSALKSTDRCCLGPRRTAASSKKGPFLGMSGDGRVFGPHAPETPGLSPDPEEFESSQPTEATRTGFPGATGDRSLPDPGERCARAAQRPVVNLLGCLREQVRRGCAAFLGQAGYANH